MRVVLRNRSLAPYFNPYQPRVVSQWSIIAIFVALSGDFVFHAP